LKLLATYLFGAVSAYNVCIDEVIL